jgi:anaerobic ribonucleoside-triphosphate reductase activating protein
MLEPWYIEGLTLLGGEPFEPENQQALLPFVQEVRRRFPNKTIWAYSGFTLEELQNRAGSIGEVTKALLNQIDILVDGRFVEAKKNLRLKFCGSSNQRLIDLKKTKAAGEIVLWEDPNGD